MHDTIEYTKLTFLVHNSRKSTSTEKDCDTSAGLAVPKTSESYRDLNNDDGETKDNV